MSYNIDLENWVDLFSHYQFQSPDFDTQIKVGWVGWSCPVESLKFKTKALGKILNKILLSKKLEPSKQYICFNSFLNKEDLKVYDEIWICNSETKNTVWIISITDSKVYHCMNKFTAPVFFSKRIGEVVNWFIRGGLKGYEKQFK